MKTGKEGSEGSEERKEEKGSEESKRKILKSSANSLSQFTGSILM